MDLSKYKNKYVRIDLANGYFYEGYVLNCDENSLELKDKKGNLVSIKESVISFIREVNSL